MIKTASCSINALFQGYSPPERGDEPSAAISGQLQVPVYQRPYVWGTPEVDRLLADLNTHFADLSPERPDFYLGSIILHQQGDILNIIDGQQRLITLALLLAATGSDTAIPAFNFSSTASIQNIYFNYQHLQKKAAAIRHLLPQIREEINVTLVVTDSEDDAYTFFETQNTGGVRLSGVDIIKAHHLRAIPAEAERSHFAIAWERQRTLKQVCTLLLKARYWTSIDGRNAPSRKHIEGLKKAIVGEFTERTRDGRQANPGYVLARVWQSDDGWQMALPKFNYAIRQPLNNGENFIDYMVAFCTLYEEILPYGDPETKPGTYTHFIRTVIAPVDGTLFSKELFEISLLCYAHRFGTGQVYEAALWLFRCAYAIRLSHEKTNREDAIPAFLRGFPLLDIILRAFDHEEVIARLCRYPCQVDGNNLEGNTVKRRYLDRLGNFFGSNFHVAADRIDAVLQQSIYQTLNKA